MKRLAPGVYDDGEGGLHIDADELVVQAGVPPEAVSERMLREVLRKVLRDLGCDPDSVPIEFTDEPLP